MRRFAVFLFTIYFLSGCAVHKSVQESKEVMEITQTSEVAAHKEEIRIENTDVSTETTSKEDSQMQETETEVIETKCYTDSAGVTHTVSTRHTVKSSNGTKKAETTGSVSASSIVTDTAKAIEKADTIKKIETTRRNTYKDTESGSVRIRAYIIFFIVILVLGLILIRVLRK